MNASRPLPSMKCVCGHWDTDHAAFTANVRPGVTRTFCDHCDCRHWLTPADVIASPAAGPVSPAASGPHDHPPGRADRRA
jgi:hypothetical protein